MSAAFIKPRFVQRIRRTPTIVLALVVLVIAIAWYVLVTNSYVAKQYEISDSRDIREELLAEIERVDVRLSAVTMPEALEAYAGELGFVRITDPRYLAVPGNAVAKR